MSQSKLNSPATSIRGIAVTVVVSDDRKAPVPENFSEDLTAETLCNLLSKISSSPIGSGMVIFGRMGSEGLILLTNWATVYAQIARPSRH